MSKPTTNKKVAIPSDLVKEFLTPSEMRMVNQRFLISELLDQGLSVRVVAARVGVGTDTVVRVSRLKTYNPKIRNLNKSVGSKAEAKWVFGKVESE